MAQLFEMERHPDGVIVVRVNSPAFDRMMPKASRGHLAAAAREMLMAFRDVLDTAIEGTEEVERTTKASTRKKTKIDVK